MRGFPSSHLKESAGMIRNETKNVVWLGNVRIADNFFRRFKGLMFEKGIDYALVFILPAETRANSAIHMFFMLEDIDVVWLDSSRRVVDFRKARRMRLYCPKKPAKYIIEGPVGLIETLKIEEDDLISWSEENIRETATPAGVPSNGMMSLRRSRPVMLERPEEISVTKNREACKWN